MIGLGGSAIVDVPRAAFSPELVVPYIFVHVVCSLSALPIFPYFLQEVDDLASQWITLTHVQSCPVKVDLTHRSLSSLLRGCCLQLPQTLLLTWLVLMCLSTPVRCE